MKRRGRPPVEAHEVAIVRRLAREMQAEIRRKQGQLEGVHMALRLLTGKTIDDQDGKQ